MGSLSEAGDPKASAVGKDARLEETRNPAFVVHVDPFRCGPRRQPGHGHDIPAIHNHEFGACRETNIAQMQVEILRSTQKLGIR